MVISFFGDTDRGRARPHNEDSYLILLDQLGHWDVSQEQQLDIRSSKGALFVVADGMGGASAGEVASDIAVTVMKEEFVRMSKVPIGDDKIRDFLISAVLKAHKQIVEKASNNRSMEGMGTTIVIGWIKEDTLYTVWSGDSRCYVYSPGKAALKPFTDDHSLVWQRVLINQITAEEARLSSYSNLILQSLGGSSQKPEPQFRIAKLESASRVMICSDGLNSMLSDTAIQEILDNKKNAKETVGSLIQAANGAGGRDNITVILADILSTGSNGKS